MCEAYWPPDYNLFPTDLGDADMSQLVWYSATVLGFVGGAEPAYHLMYDEINPHDDRIFDPK